MIVRSAPVLPPLFGGKHFPRVPGVNTDLCATGKAEPPLFKHNWRVRNWSGSTFPVAHKAHLAVLTIDAHETDGCQHIHNLGVFEHVNRVRNVRGED